MKLKDPFAATWMIADKFRSVYAEMPVRWIQTFCIIAHYAEIDPETDELTQDSLAARLECTQSAVGKLISNLASLELVSYTRDSMDERRKVLRLTAKGKKLTTDIQDILKRI